ncbi:TonB family protein [Caenimonas koreensis]|uniref:TonB family protein n=1 Tax=Caenimonas koreensis DSM 17982 TaxID=1121255 RepID=A0A844B790_9BURK|nr:TonB family protein [Caenimonas koreensis]MRD47377.1 TonB family protein [Caenimonas koreensis DSM 17982]
MLIPPHGAGAHKALSAITALITVVGMQFAATAPALAQAAAGAKEAAPSEAARRAAESPYRFILQNAAIRERPKAAAAPAPAAAPEREAPRRPAASEQTFASVPARSAPEPAPAAVVPEPAAPAPTPVAVASPQAKPAPVVAARKELIPIKQDPPELSAALAREQPTGMVTVAFDVMPDGNVTGVKVTHSSNTRLNRPSIQAIQAWKFQPIDEVRQLEIELNYK